MATLREISAKSVMPCVREMRELVNRHLNNPDDKMTAVLRLLELVDFDVELDDGIAYADELLKWLKSRVDQRLADGQWPED